jgi:choline dehydrogenase-like flavoprotein
MLDERQLSVSSFAQYVYSRNGILSHLDSSVCLANSVHNNSTDWPDIELLGSPGGLTDDRSGYYVNRYFGLQLSVFAQMYAPYYTTLRSAFLVTSVLTRPKSKGKLELKSSNPFADPKIDPKYLSNADDVKVMIDALKWPYRLAQTSAYKSIDARKVPSLVVGCELLYSEVTDTLFASLKVPNDNYLECQARRMTMAGLHMVGTCKMGSVDDTTAVVDPRLRVIGINKLRVIDASIMPVITNGNTNAPTIMIGEMGANFVKQDYHL